jgi:hypothetical protein
MGKLAVGVRFTRYGRGEPVVFFVPADKGARDSGSESDAKAEDSKGDRDVALEDAAVERKRCKVDTLGRARGRRNGR